MSSTMSIDTMNKKVTQTLSPQSGFTLVEIMVAITVGLFLLGGVLQIFHSSKSTFRMSGDISRMQENARFAMEFLTRDIRMAGFMPCARPGQVANTLNNGSSVQATNFFGASPKGDEGGTSSFSGYPSVGTTAGDRVAGTDAITILKGGANSFSIQSYNPNAAQFKINETNTFNSGDVVLICDGTSASIFQITNTNQANKTIVHNTGVGTPGNCTKQLVPPVDCTNAGNSTKTYGSDAQLVKLESVAYFIGVSTSGTTRSLYRITLNGGIAGAPQELVEGVENMQILYGVDTDLSNDNTIDRYVTANNVGINNWNNVFSVRIGLLMQTLNNVSDQNDSKTYKVASTDIGTSGAVTHASDKRVRYVFNSTIKLRNRGQGIGLSAGL